MKRLYILFEPELTLSEREFAGVLSATAIICLIVSLKTFRWE